MHDAAEYLTNVFCFHSIFVGLPAERLKITPSIEQPLECQKIAGLKTQDSLRAVRL